MILNELIGSPVVQGGRLLGLVADLRFVLDPDPGVDDMTRVSISEARLHASWSVGMRLGRSWATNGPVSPSPGHWPSCCDDENGDGSRCCGRRRSAVRGDGVLLRPQARRWSPALPGSVTQRGASTAGLTAGAPQGALASRTAARWASPPPIPGSPMPGCRCIWFTAGSTPGRLSTHRSAPGSSR